jgi:polyisoprenoid-binding protein YceI
MVRKALAAAALVSAASLVLFTAPLSARQAGATNTTGTFKIDPVHSSAVYRITHLGASAHWGMIKDPTGTFEVTPDGVSFDVTLELSKLDSANAKRDEHLKGNDFFNAKQFPQLTFKSTGSTKVDAETYTVKGDLTIKGTTKPIEVTMKKIGEGKGMQGAQLVGFEGEFTINRLEYGVNYMPGALGNDVRVIVALEGAKQ